MQLVWWGRRPDHVLCGVRKEVTCQVVHNLIISAISTVPLLAAISPTTQLSFSTSRSNQIVWSSGRYPPSQLPLVLHPTFEFSETYDGQPFPHPLRQMRAKGKVIPSMGKGEAQTKREKATPKGKANDKGNAPCVGWGCTQPSQPMDKLGSQTVKNELKALVAHDPEKIVHPIEAL